MMSRNNFVNEEDTEAQLDKINEVALRQVQAAHANGVGRGSKHEGGSAPLAGWGSFVIIVLLCGLIAVLLFRLPPTTTTNHPALNYPVPVAESRRVAAADSTFPHPKSVNEATAVMEVDAAGNLVPIDAATLACLTIQPTPTIHALGAKYGTDKVNAHRYDTLYDFWLAPYRCRKLKFLEVGLGCDMNYGPGRSYHMWNEFFPFADLHFLEVDGACVNANSEKFSNATIHVGSQSDPAVLHKLLVDSGGEFDIIVDDGSHLHDDQHLSTDLLYRFGVKKGGLFIMEDLLTSDARVWGDDYNHYRSSTGLPSMVDRYLEYLKELMFEATAPRSKSIEWTRQMSCGAGMCVMQKYTDADIENHHWAGSKASGMTKPEEPKIEDMLAYAAARRK